MNSRLPTKVLIYHRSLDSSASGGEYLPLLFISELQRRKCEITLALDWQSDIDSCAKSLGAEVNASAVHIICIKPKNRLLQRLDLIIPFYRSKMLKRAAKQCDICISTFNIFDFGRPAHHFILSLGINDNSFKNYYMHRSRPTGLKLLYVKFRSLVAEHLLRPLLNVRSTRSILKNAKEHIYPNSLYVEKTMLEFFGSFNSTLFYPPTTFTPRSGCAKHSPLKVVYLGLLSPHKHLDDIISIVKNARLSSKKDIELHIGGKLLQTDYCNHLKSVCADKNWIQLVGPKYGLDKEEFLCSGSYAIHATREEAFGIAVTEYLKAGIVPIVPDEGGTCEIVDAKDLEYSDNAHAAAILSRLVTDETFRKSMERHCMLRANLFSMQLYMTRQRELLDKIIQESRKE